MKKDLLRTPLKHSRGLGSAKMGTHHFILERLTALALIPLCVWFVHALLTRLVDGSLNSLVAWLNSPATALFFALFVILGFWHSMLGVQVIIEDYIRCKKKLFMLLLLNKGAHTILGGMSLMALFTLHSMTPITQLDSL